MSRRIKITHKCKKCGNNTFLKKHKCPISDTKSAALTLLQDKKFWESFGYNLAKEGIIRNPLKAIGLIKAFKKAAGIGEEKKQGDG